MLDQTKASDHPSTNALDRLPLQTAVIEAAWVRFTGGSQGALEEPPALDEERVYVVKAKCVEQKHKRNKDREERVTTIMEIEWVREQGKAPAGDPNQGSLLTVVADPELSEGGESDA